MEIKSSLEELEKRIAMLRKAAALAKDLKSLKDEVEALLQRLLNLEQYFNQTEQNKQDIIVINETLLTITSNISTLETNLQNTQESLCQAQDDIAMLQTITNGINSELDLLDTQISNINTNIEEFDSGLSNVNNQISLINGQIDGINSDITQIENGMITLENSFAGLQTNVNILQTKFNNLEDNVGNYDITIQDLTDRLDYVQENTNSNINSISNITQSMATIQTDITDIKNDVVALEGSYSRLEDVSSQLYAKFDTVETEIQELNDSISSLQNTVNSLSVDVESYNSQIASISNSVSEHTSQLNSLSSQVESNTGSISTLNTNLSEVSSSIGENTNQINVLNSQVEQNAQNITNLTSRVTTLENNSGGSGGGSSNIIETFNMGVEETLSLGVKEQGQNSAFIYFRCEPTAKIKIEMEVICSNLNLAYQNYSFSVYLDDKLMQTVDFPEADTSTITIPFSFDFFPKKSNYRIKIMANNTFSSNSIFDSIKMNIVGRNIIILNRHRELNVQILDNTYYITKQTGNSAVYLEQTTPALSQTGTALADISGYAFLYRFYRHATFSSSTKKWTLSNSKYAVVIVYGTERKCGVFTVGSSNTPTYRGGDMYDVYYTAKNGLLGYDFCGTTIDGKPKIALNTQFNSTNTSLYTVTLNGVPLEDKYVQCIPVVDNYLLTRADNNSAGYILLDNTGKLYYLPQKKATYMIEIGMGTQPNAYLQEDNQTINIYYTHCNTTYKRTLTLNSSEEFELSNSVETFPGVTEFIEGINGTSIQKIDGEYTVVQG